jgi:hypothetical protein
MHRGVVPKTSLLIWTGPTPCVLAKQAIAHILEMKEQTLNKIQTDLTTQMERVDAGSNAEEMLETLTQQKLTLEERCEVRRAAAGAARQHWQGALPCMVRLVQEQRAEPPDQLWEISTGSERLILDWCCR